MKAGHDYILMTPLQYHARLTFQSMLAAGKAMMKCSLMT